jgi:hypothetical protein
MSERASQARQRRIAEPPTEHEAFRGPQENAERSGAPAKSRSDPGPPRNRAAIRGPREIAQRFRGVVLWGGFVGWFSGVHKRLREEAV